MAQKSKNSQLTNLIAFYEGLVDGKFNLNATLNNSEQLEEVLTLIHINSDIFTQSSFISALQDHLNSNLTNIENLKIHQLMLEFIVEKNLILSFNDAHSASLSKNLENYISGSFKNLEIFHQILTILSTYKQLYDLSKTSEESQIVEMTPISNKHAAHFFEKLFNLFLNFESFTQEIETPIFEIVTLTMPKTKKTDKKSKKSSKQPDITQNLQLLILKALTNSTFKNSYFLDFLRYANHVNNLSAEAKTNVLTDFTSKLVKDILKNRIEWEGGIFVEKWSDIRSSVLDSSQRKSTIKLFTSVFDLCIEENRFIELSSFLGVLGVILGEGRNSVALEKKKGEDKNKNFENREYFGKLLISTLTSDKSLTQLSSKYENLSADSDDLTILTSVLNTLFTLNVRCLPGKRLKKFEQILRNLAIYKHWDATILVQVNLYSSFNSILVDFFSQNLKIQAYEDLNMTLEQANHVFQNLDIQAGSANIDVFFSYLQSSETLPSTKKGLKPAQKENLASLSTRTIEFVNSKLSTKNGEKFDIDLISKSLNVLNSIQNLNPSINSDK